MNKNTLGKILHRAFEDAGIEGIVPSNALDYAKVGHQWDMV